MDEGMLLLSTPLLFELMDAFNRKKFDKYVTETERMKFLVGLLKITELVEITEKVIICRDPSDNKLLELAVSGKADYLVTGDDDLLELSPFQTIKILSAKEFLLSN